MEGSCDGGQKITSLVPHRQTMVLLGDRGEMSCKSLPGAENDVGPRLWR